MQLENHSTDYENLENATAHPSEDFWQKKIFIRFLTPWAKRERNSDSTLAGWSQF